MSVGAVDATSGSMSRGSGVIVVLEQPSRLVLVGQRLDEQVEVAIEYALELMQREVDAVVGDARLREVVGADLLAAVTASHHRPSCRLELRVAFRLRKVV